MSNRKKYENINPLILKHILECGFENPAVLDVGCWTGFLGGALEKNNFFCEIDGIELDEGAATVAKKSGYREVFCFDLDKPEDSCPATDFYDIIVFGDVLEHLADPGKVLSKLAQKLKKGGFILVSLPNIGFVKYRLLHLFGHWQYSQSGVMDKSHLRFFTIDSARQMFEEERMEIVAEQALSAFPAAYFPVKMLAKIWPSLFGLQIVFKLKMKDKK